MKKLYSNFIYVYIVVFPLLIFLICYTINFKSRFNFTLIGPNLIVVLLISFYGFTVLKYKRVYYDNNKLYILNLLNDKGLIIDVEKVISIDRWFKTDFLNYKIVYIDINNVNKTIYFFKSFSLLFIKNIYDLFK